MNIELQFNSLNNFINNFIRENCSEETLQVWNQQDNLSNFLNVIKNNNIKIKDPNKPKRAKTMYLYFCDLKRSELKNYNNNISKNEMTQIIKNEWYKLKNSTNEDDIKLLDELKKMNERDKIRYQEDKLTYTKPTNEEIIENKIKRKKELKKMKRADSDKPKRNKSAYLYFCLDKRESVKSELGGDNIKQIDVTKELGRRWKQLSTDENRLEELNVYLNKAKNDKNRYIIEMKKYTINKNSILKDPPEHEEVQTPPTTHEDNKIVLEQTFEEYYDDNVIQRKKEFPELNDRVIKKRLKLEWKTIRFENSLN